MSSSTVSAWAGTPTPSSFASRVEEVKPSKADINFVIMDYLVNEGYPLAAKNFAKEAKIQSPTEEESIGPRVEIRNAIHAGDIEIAINKINDFNPEILDTDAALHFSLLRLQLVELIRTCMASPNSDITPALNFASTQLAPRAPTSKEFLEDLERTMALLIFPPENLAPPLAALLDPSLRRSVANKVNEAILASQGARREARIRNLVRLRAWAEKEARKSGKDISALNKGLWSDTKRNADDNGDEAMNGAGNGTGRGDGEATDPMVS